MINPFVFHVPTRIVFGCGKLAELGSTALPGKRALLVTGAGGSMKRLGHVDRVLELLRRNGADAVLFDKILPNPIEPHVAEGAALARGEGCDFVIGFGGGSAIDSAKAMAVLAANPGDYWDYVATGTGRGRPVRAALPIVAIPTTAGTGTEADPWAVVTNPATTEKIGFGAPPLTFPTLSIVDPELMVSVPPQLTAFQGMDAFFHAAEGYLSKARQPAGDHFCLDSVALVTRHLPRAVAHGEDIEARTALAWASTQSGLVETLSSCISHHSLEHALSAHYPDLPHGAGLVLLSRDYFGYLSTKVLPERFAELGRTMALARGDTDAANAADPGSFVRELDRLITAVGLAELDLAAYGPRAEQADAFADNAMTAMSRLFALDPYAFSRQEVADIFRAAIARRPA
ncbi:MAG: iron-containing alcohol dehydrogenase [Desulfovibrionaceae bacterium]|jgi:alcohol dehydrogenase|nr:iron-containing alcohol dehydrogenase [Desulfovibrionaceae bacterium]